MNREDEKALTQIGGCGCALLIYASGILMTIAAAAWAIRWIIRTA